MVRALLRATCPSLAIVLLVVARPATSATPGDTCSAAKLTAASKKTVAKLACWSKAIKKGVTVDDACLAKAEQKLTATFVAAEAKGGCRTIGDATGVEADVDDVVAMLVADEPGDCGAIGDPCGPAACCPGLACDASSGPSCQTSTTTSTVTTTTLPPCAFSPQCGGSCPAGSACAFNSTFVPPCICMPSVHKLQ
jgi:hypothetical protein